MGYNSSNRRMSVAERGTLSSRSSSRRSRVDKFKDVCKSFFTFLFSTVGLLFVLVGYILVGGALFNTIEGGFEDEKAKSHTLINDLVIGRTNSLALDIWNMTKYERIFHESNYTSKLKAKLVAYQRHLNDAIKKGYNGNLNHHNARRWTYIQSIIYSIVIITSIGYGHITCESDAGKLATMIYALFGLPITLMFLSNIGSPMANLVRFLYARVFCGYCNYVKRRNMRQKAVSLSAAVSHANALNYASSVATTDSGAVSSANESGGVGGGGGGGSGGKKQPTAAEETEILEFFEMHHNNDYKKITVPISLSLAILILYIFLGGMIFKSLEEWTLLDGIYFCFITLSTIGLGDKFPGKTINDSNTQIEFKIGVTAAYVLIGLSLCSMAISLMREKVSAKFRKIGIRLGIIDDPKFW